MISTWGGLTGIRVRNEAVQAGTRAYRAHRYAAAVQHYQRALAAMRQPEEALELNLAHAAWQGNQPVLARAYYSRLLNSRNRPLRSVAQQQLGVLQARRGDYAQAARLLRQALLTNPRNATARYNYEAVMRYLARRPDPGTPPPGQPNGPDQVSNSDEQRPKPQAGDEQSGQRDNPARNDARQPPQSQPNAQGRSTPNQTGGAGNANPNSLNPGQGTEQQVAQGRQPGNVRGLGDPTTDQPTSTPNTASRQPGAENAAADATQLQTQRARLQQMQLTPAQAQQLLNALRASEQQYIQQLPRQGPKPAPSSKPAW
ncbi:hypothetical protein I5L79_17955 [Hymenobacter sp. BT594]|uniref:Tetratricopeptide repeat protein n=1 Tax=Hymenobacter guriensis TaxID=2793065 RepID=A0ABS0L5R5_9BACT|nr:hypothetical protein [Hymenobacter guriensis]